VIAAGVGAFQPRSLKIDGLAAWREKQLFHHDPGPERIGGRRVVVVGNNEAAVTAAIAAVEAGAASVVVVHRRDDFDAPTSHLLRFQSARMNDLLEVVLAQPSGIEQGDEGTLTGLVVDGNDGGTRTLPLDVLLVLLGWSPKLGPIAQWGLALAKKQLVVDTERFETSTPGIHAVGDVVTYPGKQKLIVSGFHEATLAAYAIAERVHPERAQPLLYTTTSPKLHKLLGVAPEAGAIEPGSCTFAPGGRAFFAGRIIVVALRPRSRRIRWGCWTARRSTEKTLRT
jgi:thioredoxin reductase (NADPH)